MLNIISTRLQGLLLSHCRCVPWRAFIQHFTCLQSCSQLVVSASLRLMHHITPCCPAAASAATLSSHTQHLNYPCSYINVLPTFACLHQLQAATHCCCFACHLLQVLYHDTLLLSISMRQCYAGCCILPQHHVHLHLHTSQVGCGCQHICMAQLSAYSISILGSWQLLPVATAAQCAAAML